jgi:Uma2 family endonuclease
MSPSKQHQAIKSLIARLLETWCMDRGIEIMPYGSWTLKQRREERGAEPDECYVFDGEQTDSPHLAIEVEWTSGRIDKLEVYKRLAVDEIWYWRKGAIQVFVRDGDGYRQTAQSARLPELDLDLLASFLDRKTLTAAVRDFRAAVAARAK